MTKRIEIRESNLPGQFWYVVVHSLPQIGHKIIVAQADKGVHHRVTDIEHHVGPNEQRIVVHVRRE